MQVTNFVLRLVPTRQLRSSRFLVDKLRHILDVSRLYDPLGLPLVATFKHSLNGAKVKIDPVPVHPVLILIFSCAEVVRGRPR